jgi:hypothetical protein
MIFGLGIIQPDHILPELGDNGFTTNTKAKRELETDGGTVFTKVSMLDKLKNIKVVFC